MIFLIPNPRQDIGGLIMSSSRITNEGFKEGARSLATIVSTFMQIVKHRLRDDCAKPFLLSTDLFLIRTPLTLEERHLMCVFPQLNSTQAAREHSSGWEDANGLLTFQSSKVDSCRFIHWGQQHKTSQHCLIYDDM